MTVDIATLAIRIDSMQAQSAATAMDRMRDAGARAEKQIINLDDVTRKLSQALKLIGVGTGVGAIIKMADEYTKFSAQIQLATQSQREYNAAMEDVKRIANTAQQDLAATGTLYARIANGTRELGTTQKQVAAITETVNLALKVSGATAQESASAQLQLSQAFASGALRGEEFNAVNETAPRLMKALADGMGVPIGALRQMAQEGKITSAIMADVLPKALEQVRVEAAKIQTVGGSFTVLKNSLLEFIGTQAQASGVVSVLTTGIELLAKNLGLLAGVMATVAAASIASKITAWTVKTYERITAVYAQVVAENAARAATIAAAEADVAAASASVALGTATNAAIIVSREEAVARLAQARSNIVAAQSAMTAAEAAGAQSFALRTLRLATAELAVAEQTRAAATAELALLGQQQARVSAQIAAATAAEAAAKAALTAANGTATASAGLLARAVGFLGGPISIIVTLLGLAATAWMVWGKKAEDGNKQAAESFDEAQQRIMKGLNDQIAKQEALLRLKGQGLTTQQAEKDLPIVTQIEAAKARLDELKTSMNLAPGESWTQRFAEIKKLTAEINQQEKDLATTRSNADKINAISVDELAKKKKEEYATDAEKMAKEIKDIEILKGKTSEYEVLLGRIQKKYADKSAANSLKQEHTAYQNLITKIEEKIAANRLEMSGYNQLSESQKLTIALDAEISTGKTKLNAKDIEAARARIAVVAATDKVIASNKLAQKGFEDYTKMVKDHNEQVEKSIKSANDEADKNEELVKTFGMTKAAIEAMELARLEDQLAQKSSMGLTLDEIDTLNKLIDAKKRNVAAVNNLEQLEAQKKANEEMVADYKKTVEQYDDVFRKGFTDMLNSGKSGWKSFTTSLVTTFKTTVADQIYKMFAQPFVVKLIGSLVGIASGGVASAAGSALGTAASTAGVAGSIGSLAGIGSVLGSIGGIATGALQTSAALLTGQIAIGQTLSAGLSALSTGTAAGAIAGLSSTIGVLGTIGLGIAGGVALLNKAFGSGPKEVTGTTLTGTLTPTGASASTVDSWQKKGGWFSSTKRGTDTTAFTAEQNAALASSYKAILDISTSLGTMLGASTDALSTRVQQLNIDLTGLKTEAEQMAKITAFFEGVADTVATELVPNLSRFQKEGEALSATLQRVATDYAKLDASLASIGTTFGAVGVSSIEARERLIAAAGGIDALVSGVSYFQQNYLTDAERLVPVQKQLAETMAQLGLSSITTVDQFKAYTLGIDKTTESGATLFTQMLALAPAFKQVTDAANTQAAALAEATAQAAAAQAEIVAVLAETNKGYQDQINQLLAAREGSTAVRALEIAGMDASTVALYDRLAALKAEDEATRLANEAIANAAASAKAAAESLANTNAGYQQQIDSLLASRQGEAAIRALEIKGMDASTVALYDRLAALKAEDAATKSSEEAVKNHTDAVEKSRSALAQAYERESSAIQGTIDKAMEAAKAFRAFSDELKLGDLSTLSPEAKYAEARRQFETASPEKLQDASKAFLEASKAYNSNNEAYASDYMAVQDAINKAANAADAQAAAEKQHLVYLQMQVSGIEEVNKSVLSVAEALGNYKSAVSAPLVMPSDYVPKNGVSNSAYTSGTTAGWTEIDWNYIRKMAADGSHENGLWSVPKDGYFAELHKDEAVLTSSQANQWRASQGAASAQDNSEVVGMLREVVNELRSDKIQRSAVGVEMIKKLDQVANGLDKTTRKLETLK